uniref:Polyprotein n=1 Tax=Artichoke latent virus TaxID=46076 RepID=A0A0D5CVH9_9POTY|nr:polyprotein [Artichoke latent virus]
MATVEANVNFKVDNVDTLNTHLMQLMSGSALKIQPLTAAALMRMVDKHFEVNAMNKGSEFVMIDGGGKTLATFNTSMRNNANLETFMKGEIKFPAQQSFELCDKIVKCTKMHQQHVAHTRLPASGYTFGGYSKLCPIPLYQGHVAKQGHCFKTLMLAISYFVTKEFDGVFAGIMDEVTSGIKSWPSLKDVSKICQYIISKVPILGPVPIPVVAVDHAKKLIHICDQRGIPDGWHQLKMGTLAELANSGLLSQSSLHAFFVGGDAHQPEEMLYLRGLSKVKANLRTWITKGTMIDDLARDIDLAAFMMLSPVMLSRLRTLIDREEASAMKAIVIDSSCNNKLVVASALKTAVQGVLVHTGETRIEKIWLQVNNVLQDHLNNEGKEVEVALSRALHRLHNHLMSEKKLIFSYERRLNLLTHDQFKLEFGCSHGWGSKFYYMLAGRNGETDVGKSSISYKIFNDGITHRTIEAINAYFLISTVCLINTLNALFGLVQFAFYIMLMCFGFMSLTKFMFHCAKALLIRRLATNWERMMIITSIFLIYELSRFIMKKKAEREKLNEGRSEELQASVKSSEKQMMAAMAMMTLVVHAFDIDLAITMSGALNHVARLANMLTDTTSGWLVGGTATEELQMHIFDVALEVDEQQRMEGEMMASTSSSLDTFSSWVNESVAAGVDNTRPLTYGSIDNVYKLDSENGAEVGAAMTNTKKAWSHVVGKTGSGKSTRVPLGYYNALQTMAARRRNILICEPTQATTQNVANALSHFHGKSVFYKHEGKEQMGDMSIQVMTYGSAFFRSVHNPTFLDDFDAVFLDESHLITPHSLALESLLNKHTRVRKFYLSATPRNGISCDDVARRFQIYEHTVEKCSVDEFIAQLDKGTATDPMKYGDKVLVFLAGKSECDKAASKVMSTNLGIKALSLHKSNFKANYTKVMNSVDGGDRVIIFSTNILETGVTLNVDVVVDFGFTNSPVLDLTGKTFLLERRRVTQAERKQRIGRAGRLRDGHAIVIGKVGRTEELVSADVVYEAALISFVYNIDIYINSHFDHVWIGNVTRQQAKTMINFRLPSFAMKDVVFPDGSVRDEFLRAVKDRTNRSANIKTLQGCTINPVYEGWPVLGTYAQKFGIAFEDSRYSTLSKMRVPFIFHDMNELDIEAYAEAAASYKPSVLTRWAKPAKEVSNVILHVNQKNVCEAIGVVRSLIASTKSLIQSKKHNQNLHRESPLACLFTKRTTLELESKLGEQIKLGERNLVKLTKLLGNLELFMNLDEMKDEEPELSSGDMEEIGRVLELQMQTTCNEDHIASVLHLEELPSTTFREAIVIGRKRVACALVLMCIAAFGGLAWYYLWDDDTGLDNRWNKKNKKAVLKDVLEMKGKSFNRDKRSATAYEKILKDSYEGEDNYNLDEFRTRRKGRAETDKTPFENLMTKAAPFITMYDITSDENVVNAVFMDHNKQAFYETADPIKNMGEVKKHLDQMKSKQPVFKWGDEADDDVFCDVTTRDGTTIRVRLTPHNSQRLTATHGVQGYAQNEGRYRQTGDAEVLKMPTQHLEVNTRLADNMVNLDVGNMIGLVNVKGGNANCLLYKDWVIMPAHVMMCPLPITLTFKHYTVTLSDLPECYCFVGFDLLAIKRPSTLAPVRCSATLESAKSGMTVQMLYKKPVINKTLMTVTDVAYKTKEYRWEHQIPTVYGMCGAPMLDVSSGKIVGIHILGDSERKCNTFEGFPSDMLKLVNSNDPKVRNLYVRERVKTWEFVPEMHGHNSARIKNLQIDTIEFKQFSRDTSVYTVENLTRSATAGGLFKPREVMEKRKLPPTVSAIHMHNLAYSNGLLNTRHIFEGENPYWKQFKLCNEWVEPIVERYEDNYMPSALNREAYWKDLLKYNRPQHLVKVDDVALKSSVVQLVRELERAGMTKTKIRTVDQVLEDIQWGKAAGPLYGMKKKELCKNLTMEELTSLALHCRSELNKGKNAGLWNGSLKAELRPKIKVEANKTRVFTAAPITTLIGSKFFVDDFNKQFYASHLKAPHTVGINKFSNGWAKVHEKLNREGWLHGSGDGSRFDSSIDPFLFDMIYTIRCHFMCDDDRREATRAMSNMFREFVFTPIHTISGNILVKNVGNNSGQPSTVVDNTLVLMLSFYYAYAVKTKDYAFDHIDERFVFVCNGDDNKFAVSPAFVKEFGGIFTDEIAQLGLNYEFDTLTPDITANPYMSLTMISVCGRIGFQLNPERILGIVQWIKKGGVVHASQAAFAAMIESFNDPDLFGVMHSYLIWLLVTYRQELRYAMHNDLVSVVYMDPAQVFALHYNDATDHQAWFSEESDDVSDSDDDSDGEPDQELQMNREEMEAAAKKEQEEKDAASSRDEATRREEAAIADKARKKGNDVAEPSGSSPGTSQSPPEKGNEDVAEPQGDPEEREEDVKWVMPALNPNRGGTIIPTINGKKLWKRGILKHVPQQQYDATTTKATQTQLTSWVEAVKKDLRIRDDNAWALILTAWCIWCADNGTSPEVDTNQELEIHDGLGKVQAIRIDSFVDPALENGGLRKIMRHFSGITQEILAKGKRMSAYGIKRGFTDKIMIPYAFDFMVADKRTPKAVREQLAQAKIAAIGQGTRRSMIVDGSVNGSRVSHERHTDQDQDEFEHGGDVDRRPYLT